MTPDIEITDKCFDCDKNFKIHELYGICDECFEKRMLVQLVEEAIDHCKSRKHEWEDKEFYVGFNSDNERDIFLRGIKRGYDSALFWIADFFGIDYTEID